jgi:hypothetical protein
MIEELWKCKYPTIRYHTLRKATAPGPEPKFDYPASERSIGDGNLNTGSPVTSYDPNVIDIYPELSANTVNDRAITQFDALWGESVDDRMQLPNEGWQQPHTTDAEADIAEVEKHDGPFYVHAQVRREPTEKELKKYGFDKVRDLLVHVPISLIDKMGIKVQPGDWFVWDDTEYSVLQVERTGYWMNTNIRLYFALNCEHRRRGS